MHIVDMTYWWKDTGSGVNGCPALYGATGDFGVPGVVAQGKLLDLKDDDRPGFVVYGTPLTDPADRARLRDLAPDEDAVWVPADGLHLAAADDRAELRELAPGEAAVWVPANVLDLSRVPVEA